MCATARPHAIGEEEEGDESTTFKGQQGFFDLDNDSYEEPYPYVVELNSRTVVRIIPRFDLSDVLIKDEVKLRAAKLSDLISDNGSLSEAGG